MDGNENSCPKLKANKSYYGNTHTGVDALSSKVEQIDFRPFACSFKGCGKLFKLKHHKTEHERIHTGECPYTCFYCGRLFKRKTHLDRHELLHLGDSGKSFICSWPSCKCKFVFQCDLDYHFKVHVNGREHVCGVDLCGRSYLSKKSLENHHKRFHLHLRDFKCGVDGCIRTFCFKAELNAHLRKKHKIDPPSKYMDSKRLLQLTRDLLKQKQLKGPEQNQPPPPSKIIIKIEPPDSHSQPVVKIEPKSNKEKKKHKSNKENQSKTKILVNNIKIEPQEENSSSIKKEKKEWECRHCHRAFKSKERRQRHKERKQHFSTELVECVICYRPFKTFKRLGAHIVNCAKENVKVKCQG